MKKKETNLINIYLKISQFYLLLLNVGADSEQQFEHQEYQGL